ncbi:MAG: LysM peptidoglycan-binding domain-containing protein [Nitrospirae bacterium]|jgi:cell wall-associated NlpC family hydrolase|nr:LysM peptidoglycan-binding domain-containing protein [Nitrospirota bacterium]
MKNVAMFLVSFICLLFFATNSFADKTYVIKKGDTPKNIAKKFKVNVKDILECNNINSTNLKPGQKIKIPSKTIKKEKNKPAEKVVKNKSPKEIKSVMYNPSSFHIVKKGDTLRSISRKYSISVDELKEINNLKSSKLKIGQKLLFKKHVPDEYIVKKGDTLWSIAKKYNLDPEELMDINNLEDDSLPQGYKLILKPQTPAEEYKTYDTFISQAPVEKEIENLKESPTLQNLSIHDRLILFAKKMLDIPYRFGGNSLFGIDCSGYVKKVYSLIGINLPRSAREQFTEGKSVETEELNIGDLVFFKTYASFPSHVGIYLGNNLFIHASSRSKKVTIDSLDTPYYFKRFIGAKRVLQDNNEKPEKES